MTPASSRPSTMGLARAYGMLFTLLTAIALLVWQPAHAQLRVDISGTGATQYPVAIADFAVDDVHGRAIADVIRADLTRTGQFRLINASGAGLNVDSQVNYDDWRNKGADFLAYGSITRGADGRYDVRYRLGDTIKKGQLDGVAFSGSEQELRRVAHQIADRIYEKITGVRGVFSTRIAYVLKRGNTYELQIADADGQNPQVALRSREPVISPAWSPDGSKLAVALTRDGLSQIYIVSADGSSNARRLTRSPGIDTEPVFTPDGRSIIFTSDRSGGPQIYQTSLDGGDARRLTFNGSYNISPRISPDGSTLLYVSRRDGAFRIASLDLATGNETLLTDGRDDQSPSFAPNGKQILYAAVQNGRSVLAGVSSDGRVRQTLSVLNGEIREPTWGPFTR